jgi:hypothetical protein
MSEAIELKKREDGTYAFELPAEQVAELEAARAGVLEGISKTEVFGIPAGQAAGGLLAVSVWDAIRGLLGGVLPAQVPGWMIPAIGAWVMNTRTIQGMLGKTASDTAGIILTADAVQALFNVRGLISGLVSGVKLGGPAIASSSGNGSKEKSLAEFLRS